MFFAVKLKLASSLSCPITALNLLCCLLEEHKGLITQQPLHSVRSIRPERTLNSTLCFYFFTLPFYPIHLAHLLPHHLLPRTGGTMSSMKINSGEVPCPSFSLQKLSITLVFHNTKLYFPFLMNSLCGFLLLYLVFRFFTLNGEKQKNVHNELYKKSNTLVKLSLN